MSKFKWVPVEPTEEMFKAARRGLQEKYGMGVDPDKAAVCWWSMLAAAPVQAFDEAAERELFEAWFLSKWPANQLYRRDALPKDDKFYGEYCNPHVRHSFEGWLACARSKAGGDQ